MASHNPLLGNCGVYSVLYGVLEGMYVRVMDQVLLRESCRCCYYDYFYYY